MVANGRDASGHNPIMIESDFEFGWIATEIRRDSGRNRGRDCDRNSGAIQPDSDSG